VNGQGEKDGGAAAAAVTRRWLWSGDFFVEKNDAVQIDKPDGFAGCALNEVLRITIGMHVDFDTGRVAANRAFHVYSPFRHISDRMYTSIIAFARVKV
jgi:predicted AAA+ superfamily ATPase